MDTGSDMLWVNCLPCIPCAPISGALLFDPLKSKTYFPRPCTRNCMQCTGDVEGGRDCMYKTYYMGGFHSEGVYATDQLTFRTSDDAVISIPDIQFGCSSSIIGTNTVDFIVNGILGLGRSIGRAELPFGEKPLITKLGSKFSYCVGSASDHTYMYNHLTIGDEADLLGTSTPFYTRREGGAIYFDLTIGTDYFFNSFTLPRSDEFIIKN
ncbi:Aspartyl protease UND [Linum perenne]